MKRLLAASGLFLFFLLFLLFGGAWIWLARLIPAGPARGVVLIGLGVLFVGAFVWLLVSRIRRLLGGTEHLWRELSMVGAELLLLIVAFASVYHTLGIIDNRAGGVIVHDFWSSVYYSIITLTTVGYGDFYPHGLGRALAALQGLTGYVILGVIASTAASIISPHSAAGWKGEEE